MSKVEVIKEKVFIDGVRYLLPSDGSVDCYLKIKDLLVVLFRTGLDPEIDQNIFAFKENGDLAWKIESYSSVHLPGTIDADFFIDFFWDESQLIARHVNGTSWLVNLSDGTLTAHNPEGGRPW